MIKKLHVSNLLLNVSGEKKYIHIIHTHTSKLYAYTWHEGKYYKMVTFGNSCIFSVSVKLCQDFFLITLKFILKFIIFKSLEINIRHNYYLHVKVLYYKRIYKQK